MRARRRQRGFSLLEAVTALAIFGMAIVVAAGFLDAHMSAARRLETRADLVRAAEVILESLRGEALPFTVGAVDLSDQFPPQSSARVTTSVQVTPRSLTGLYEVRVEARAVVRSEEMVVTVTTQMWKP
ncbi:MAG: type II secretion system protein [Acidobacteria bacterium]|nr:type II secretion system protein [Acidobacteriota bacterium]